MNALNRVLCCGLLAGFTSLAAAANDCPAPQLALGRPHTDFVQWQVMPSRVLGPTNSLPGVKATALSYDAKGTRAVTVIFEFPAGWSMDKPHYVNSDQEFLVLAGSLEIDDLVYRTGDYAYLPAGFAHHLLRSESGATLINFYEGEHLAKYEAAPAGMYQPRKLVRRTETAKLRWKTARDGSKRKLLRTDRSTGEQTWLLQVPASSVPAAGKISGAPELRNSVEEFFLLDGELVSPRGTLKTGGYAWRAPHTAIGPSFTATGYTALLRSKGGAPGGSASTEQVEYAVDTPYQPCLPEAAKAPAASK